MARLKKLRTARGTDVKHQTTTSLQIELPVAPNDFGGADSIEKDATELELEKLLFGDETGFREGLKSYRDEEDKIGISDLEDREKDALAEGAVDLEALNDNDVHILLC